jgi:predicted dehydrogenase
MKIGVLGGAGSIGSRHCRNLAALGHEAFVIDLGIITPGSASVEAMVVATPATVRPTFKVPTFYEKPLALDIESANKIRSGTVGFNLRFVPAVAELKQNIENQRVIFARVHFSSDLREWRKGDYRQSVSAQKCLGGGILNEAQHELDLIRHLFGEWSWVQGWTTNSGRLEIDVEDVAVALIGLIDGGIVELHLDMVQPGYRRGVEVLTDKGDYVIDLHWDGERELNQMYLDEMAAFLRSIDGERDPRAATIEDGIAAVELSDAIKESSRTGERVFSGAEVEGCIYPTYALWR